MTLVTLKIFSLHINMCYIIYTVTCITLFTQEHVLHYLHSNMCYIIYTVIRHIWEGMHTYLSKDAGSGEPGNKEDVSIIPITQSQ